MTPKVSPFASPEVDSAQALRRLAEERILAEEQVSPPESLAGMTPVEMLRTLHEMRVYQIEMEAKNEELRQARAELETSEARYREIFELAVDGILQGNSRGFITGANAQMLKLAGRSLSQLLGQHVSVLFEPEELSANPLRFDRLDEAQLLVIERHLARPDGSRVPVEMHSKRMPDGTYQTIYRDITQRRRAEAALAKNRSLLTETERIGKVGGWELDLETNQLIWTEEIYRIQEVDLTYQPTVDKAIGFYAPASRPVIERAMQRAIDHGEPFDLELDIITAKDNLRAVHAIGKPHLDHRKIYGFFQDITERKQAERELNDLHELFRAFMRHAPVYSYIQLVTPTESRVLHASDNYESMLGRPIAEILGKPVTDLLPPEVAARLHAVDMKVVTTGETIQTEEELNGRTYSTIIFPIIQGSRTLVAGYTIDITAQKRAELTLWEWNQTLEKRVAERTADLQQSEARFRHLAETTFEGIAISEDGRLVDGNAQLCRIHGYELAEMIGRPVMDFVAPESRAKVAQCMRLGQEITYECMGLRKDGSTFPTEVHGRMGTWHGKISRFTALRDLTESKRLAVKLRTQQTDLEHAQRLALISEVCAGIVHQISQPLCAMGANLAVIQANLAAAPETRGETLAILKDLDDDVACIRQVMLHMRTLLHTDGPNPLPADFHGLLEGALRLLRQEADHRGIRLAVELGIDLPPVLADSVQLNQVVLNLTRNAFEACANCPPDRRLVTITTRALAGTAVELCVRDTGTGIAPEVMNHLFAPFFTTKAGLGIGLRLSRTIVEVHGGSIEASNNADGSGATFRVTLPGHFPESQ